MLRTCLAVVLVLSSLVPRGGALAQETEVSPSFYGVGDVVYSVLPPELFAEAHAGQWVLANGGTLSDSTDLYRFLQDRSRLDLLENAEGAVTVPDARGVFVRGMNLGRDAASGDPEGDRAVGTFQGDMIGSHTHRYAISHDRVGDPDGSDDTSGGTGPGDSYWRGNKNPDFNANTAPTGGAETRPRNVTLYTYIKIGN